MSRFPRLHHVRTDRLSSGSDLVWSRSSVSGEVRVVPLSVFPFFRVRSATRSRSLSFRICFCFILKIPVARSNRIRCMRVAVLSQQPAPAVLNPRGRKFVRRVHIGGRGGAGLYGINFMWWYEGTVRKFQGPKQNMKSFVPHPTQIGYAFMQKLATINREISSLIQRKPLLFLF